MGFALVGIYKKVGYKLGAWRDVGWWELALQPETDSPAEPRPPLLISTSHL
jgi:phosphinothricin acetyltransferase